MASLGVIRNPASHQGVGSRMLNPLSAGNRSPLLSPRCCTPPPAAAMKPSFGCSTTQQRRSFDDSYDSAVPMCVGDAWERVQEDLGIWEPPGNDAQEWEEMVSLLSFDGEEHKRVMRQMHGANARVEDMFASFDGDDFEAVMRSARGEVPHEPEPSADEAAQQQRQRPQQAQTPSRASDSNGKGSSSLYTSVCALRAAAMAAEAARKRVPGLRRRRAPVNDTSSADAWMLQVPYAVAPMPQQQQQQRTAAGAEGSQMQAVTGAEGTYSHSSSSGSPLAPHEQQLVGYIGMSCDSSSDGSCYHFTDHGSCDRHVEQAVLPAAVNTSTAAAALSSNIVSSRHLRSKLSQAAVVAAAAAGAPGAHAHGRGSGAATAVLLEPAVATLPAAAAAAAVGHMELQLSPQRQPQRVRALTAEQQQHKHVGLPGGQRWSGSSTRGIRRALARLHNAHLGGCEP